jgi:hypothetical protein
MEVRLLIITMSIEYSMILNLSRPFLPAILFRERAGTISSNETAEGVAESLLDATIGPDDDGNQPAIAARLV